MPDLAKKGIIKEMLTAEEVKWFNDYHRTVYEKLSPSLNEEEKKWLLEATKAIFKNSFCLTLVLSIPTPGCQGSLRPKARRHETGCQTIPNHIQ